MSQIQLVEKLNNVNPKEFLGLVQLILKQRYDIQIWDQRAIPLIERAAEVFCCEGVQALEERFEDLVLYKHIDPQERLSYFNIDLLKFIAKEALDKEALNNHAVSLFFAIYALEKVLDVMEDSDALKTFQCFEKEFPDYAEHAQEAKIDLKRNRGSFLEIIQAALETVVFANVSSFSMIEMGGEKVKLNLPIARPSEPEVKSKPQPQIVLFEKAGEPPHAPILRASLENQPVLVRDPSFTKQAKLNAEVEKIQENMASCGIGLICLGLFQGFMKEHGYDLLILGIKLFFSWRR